MSKVALLWKSSLEELSEGRSRRRRLRPRLGREAKIEEERFCELPPNSDLRRFIKRENLLAPVLVPKQATEMNSSRSSS